MAPLTLIELYQRIRDNNYIVTIPPPFIECKCGERHPGHHFFDPNLPICPKCNQYVGDAITKYQSDTAKYLANRKDAEDRFKIDALTAVRLLGHAKESLAWDFAIKVSGDEGQIETLDTLVELSLIIL